MTNSHDSGGPPWAPSYGDLVDQRFRAQDPATATDHRAATFEQSPRSLVPTTPEEFIHALTISRLERAEGRSGWDDLENSWGARPPEAPATIDRAAPESQTDDVEDLTTVYLDHRYHDDEAVNGASYQLRFSDGSVRDGSLSAEGTATISDAPTGSFQVQFGPDVRPYVRADSTAGPQPEAIDALIDRHWAQKS